MRDTFEEIRAYAAAKKARTEVVNVLAPARPELIIVPALSGDTAYGMAALAAECSAISSLPPDSTRNNDLNRAAIKLSGLVAGGQLTEGTMLVNLEAAARACLLDQAEIDLVLRTDATGALAVGRRRPRGPVIRAVVTAASIDDWPPPAPEFWAARPELTHIADFARARRACPWAVLGVVLARLVVALPPWVVLPPLVGADASLNLFVALVSASGGGKGASEAAAADAVQIGEGNRHVDTAGVGSGEGIAHLFARRTKTGVEAIRTAVLMKVIEIDTLAALGDRKGATLLPELRKAWSGEDLGFAYADPTKALPLPAHSYRLCLVAGVQPGRAQWVLDDADGGTPQRFLWLPATDPAAPDLRPPCPPRWVWTGPEDFPMADAFTTRVVLPVAEIAREVIDTARLARLRGDGEALDGHALLTRLKTAAAIGLLAGRLGVSAEDWELAGVIAGVSETTRAGVVDHLRREAATRNRSRAEAEAERAITVTDRQEADAMKKAGTYVMRRLTARAEGMTGGELRRGTTGPQRAALTAALEALSDAGQIEAEPVGNGGSTGLLWKVKK